MAAVLQLLQDLDFRRLLGEFAAFLQQSFATLDQPGQGELLLMAEQVDATDVLQVQAHQVTAAALFAGVCWWTGRTFGHRPMAIATIKLQVSTATVP